MTEFLTGKGALDIAVRNSVIPKEPFVAPSIHVGQIHTDSFGMTVHLVGLGLSDAVLVNSIKGFTCKLCLLRK